MEETKCEVALDSDKKLIEETIEKGSVYLLLKFFPAPKIQSSRYVRKIVDYLFLHKANEKTLLALYDVLTCYPDVKLENYDTEEHLLVKQPSYSSLIQVLEMQKLVGKPCAFEIQTDSQDQEWIQALLFGIPLTHSLAWKPRVNNQKIVINPEQMLQRDEIQGLPLNYSILLKVLDRLRALKEAASVYFEKCAAPYYWQWITPMIQLIKKRFVEIDEKTIAVLQELYPKEKSTLAQLKPRKWQTELCRSITELSIHYVCALLGTTREEVLNGFHLRQLQLLDQKGIEEYVKEYVIWHQKKLQSTCFNESLFNEVDTCERKLAELPMEHIFCVRNASHTYLFSKHEWSTLSEKRENFYTKETLSQQDVTQLNIKVRQNIHLACSSTLEANLKRLEMFRLLNIYESYATREAKMPNTTEYDFFAPFHVPPPATKARHKKRTTIHGIARSLLSRQDGWEESPCSCYSSSDSEYEVETRIE